MKFAESNIRKPDALMFFYTRRPSSVSGPAHCRIAAIDTP
jgi:hypothetical protein